MRKYFVLPSLMYSAFNFLLQVKTLSFITHLLRSNLDYLRTFESAIVKSVMMLLQSCPQEGASTRRVSVQNCLSLSFSFNLFIYVIVLSTHDFAFCLLYDYIGSAYSHTSYNCK